MLVPGQGGFWRLGPPQGWGIRVHWSCALMAAGLAQVHSSRLKRLAPELSPTTRWLSGLAAGCLPLASMALHELGHVMAARRLRLKPGSVVLTPMAAATVSPEDPPTPGSQLTFALSGPGANLALAAAAAVAARLSPPGVPRALASMAAGINAALGLSNLIPSLPLDGGLATHAWRWGATGDRAVAERESHALGQLTGAALLGLAAAELRQRRPGPRLVMASMAALTCLFGPMLARRLGPDPFGVLDK